MLDKGFFGHGRDNAGAGAAADVGNSVKRRLSDPFYHSSRSDNFIAKFQEDCDPKCYPPHRSIARKELYLAKPRDTGSEFDIILYPKFLGEPDPRTKRNKSDFLPLAEDYYDNPIDKNSILETHNNFAFIQITNPKTRICEIRLNSISSKDTQHFRLAGKAHKELNAIEAAGEVVINTDGTIREWTLKSGSYFLTDKKAIVKSLLKSAFPIKSWQPFVDQQKEKKNTAEVEIYGELKPYLGESEDYLRHLLQGMLERLEASSHYVPEAVETAAGASP